MVSLLGSRDELLAVIERSFATDIHVRGNEITVTGTAAEAALVTTVFDELIGLLDQGEPLTADAVERTAAMVRRGTVERPAEVLTLNIVSSRGKTIRPKTLNQKRYVDAIDTNTVIFGIGPAGTGKTYLAMAKAVQALQAKQVNRIILTRPAVEAGERLGFLPGTLFDKIDPYLRPLYDALHDMIDPESIPRLMAAGTIEVAPLAYMRGRTLNDAFIILDEAQNTSAEQMKMFLTRLGFGSKIVVTGDVTQTDLPKGTTSGLRVVREILDGIDDVHFSVLSSEDVVRHRLVAEIVDAYGRYDESRQDPAPRAPSRPRPYRAGGLGVSIEVANESGRRGRRGRAVPARHVRPRPHGRQPAGRALGPARRRAGHGGPARQVDERAGPDRRAGVPDGRDRRLARAAGRRAAGRSGAARRRRALPRGRRQAGGRGRPLHRGRAAHARHPRRAAPAGLRPRRARRGPGDVRAAGPSCSRPGAQVRTGSDPRDHQRPPPAGRVDRPCPARQCGGRLRGCADPGLPGAGRRDAQGRPPWLAPPATGDRPT